MVKSLGKWSKLFPKITGLMSKSTAEQNGYGQKWGISIAIAGNLTFHKIRLLQIDKIVQNNSSAIILRYDNKDWSIPATHEVYLTGNNMNLDKNAIANPNHPVVALAYISKNAHLIGRQSGSKLLIQNEDVYFILTYYDVVGYSPRGGAELKRVGRKKKILYLQKATLEQSKIVLEALKHAPDPVD